MRNGSWLAAAVLPLMAAAQSASAQEYLLPNAPGKTEITGACESCHGIMETLKHKRSPRQWDEVIGQMIVDGADVNDQQRKTILAYLDKYQSQSNDYVPQPPPLQGVGPGLSLALQAAEAAEQACRTKGREVTVLVVDSAGMTLVQLTGEGGLHTQVDAATKVATVLRFKQPTSVVLKRLNTDPVLVAEVKNDPEIGEVLQGGLPITVNGTQLIGAIAVAGSHGLPQNGDDWCAQAGLDQIQAGLKQLGSRLR